MRLISFTLMLVFFFSCNKNKHDGISAFKGVWVETKFRLDTLDFEYDYRIDRGSSYPIVAFNSNTYMDTVLNPNYPINHSTSYDYYFNDTMNKIYMRDILSSYNGFPIHSFTLAEDKLRFTISKFYLRRSLPAIIEFEKIK
jgi:hypothetical protein